MLQAVCLKIAEKKIKIKYLTRNYSNDEKASCQKKLFKSKNFCWLITDIAESVLIYLLLKRTL